MYIYTNTSTTSKVHLADFVKSFQTNIYYLFLCCVAPTAPAVQPAVPLAVYGRRRLRIWARLHVRLSRFACMMRLLSPAIVRKTRGRDCGQRLSRKGARPLLSALPHGSPESRSDDPRRTTGGQRANIDVHGRLQRKRDGRGGHLKQNMATRCDSSGISFQTQCLHGPLSAVSIPDSSGVVCQFQSQLDEICPLLLLKTPLARAMSENVANNRRDQF